MDKIDDLESCVDGVNGDAIVEARRCANDNGMGTEYTFFAEEGFIDVTQVVETVDEWPSTGNIEECAVFPEEEYDLLVFVRDEPSLDAEVITHV